jgi:hypothetical protein
MPSMVAITFKNTTTTERKKKPKRKHGHNTTERRTNNILIFISETHLPNYKPIVVTISQGGYLRLDPRIVRVDERKKIGTRTRVWAAPER